MQACGVDAELADEDALEKALAEMRIKIGEDSETLRTLTMKIIDEQRKQREMFDEFKISFDSLKEGLRSQSQNSN
jgi:predicted RNA-binding protein associated with RNAse of E/G family